ncbi:MAG: Chemotaxis protein CheA [Candidatus Heimdallarchaeota archaeon LC_2]|nr:MAG: Chemotaxis protein CheA [Candidatus Heimdallarchaeota archaeon LC_2]
MDDMSEYLDIFLAELEENIQLLNSSLIDVEKDASKESTRKDLIRAVHTIKGMAATMGFDNVTKLTHEVENHLMSLTSVSKSLIQTLYKVADRLEQFRSKVVAKTKPESLSVDDLVNELKSGAPAAAARIAAATKEPSEDIRVGITYKIEIKFVKQARLLGARGFQILRVIDSISQINTSDPSASVLEEGKLLGDIEMEIISYESEIELRAALSGVEDVQEITISRLIDKAPVTELPVDGVRLKRSIQSVRVNLDRLDSVIDLLGELVITRGRFQSLVDSVTPEISEQFQIFDDTINTIQDTVMGLRMVPLNQILETYPRTVRDIAHKRNMEIDLLLQGTHIQIDRSVIDQVNEALLHLIRNAAIHGIEDKNNRGSKSKKGTIRLAARRERGEVVFEIEDDGQGLNLERIKTRAVELGLITSEQELTRRQLALMIFQSGFSTADEITDIAGRGVGMDIVKSVIDEINGSIEIRTKRGQGTKFIIRVPQTLAIIDGLIVKVKDTDFAIPLLNIEKIFSIHDPAIEYRDKIPYLNFEGNNIRIIDLAAHLRVPDFITPISSSNGNGDSTGDNKKHSRKMKSREKVILWERAGRRIGIKVTRVVENKEIVTKQLDKVYSHLKGFLGATILGYDQVALIIDPDTLEDLI